MSSRARAIAAVGLVITASLGVQTSAILAHGLFDELGPAGVSGLRFAMAAALAALIVRPRLRGRSRAQWTMIALFGMSIAGMNAFLYLALERLPLGVALTLEFLGPFAVAVVGARRPRAMVFPALGFVGVVLIVRPSGDLDPLGVALGLVAGASLGAYALLAERVGGLTRGFDGLALALVVAAVLTAPFAIMAAPAVQGAHVPVLLASAVLGVVVAFAADYLAVRLSSARVVAVLLSFDPVLAAVLGAVALGQTLDPVTVGGIALVAVAGGVSAALVGRSGERPIAGVHRPNRRAGRSLAGARSTSPRPLGDRDRRSTTGVRR